MNEHQQAFRRGIAIGIQNIRNDSIMFRYQNEFLELPTYDVLGYKGVAHYNGTYYEAPIKALRKLLKQKEAAHG